MLFPSRPPVRLLFAAAVFCATTKALGATVIVSTSGLTFVPDEVIVQLGDTVRWTDLQAGFHNVAETDSPADNVWNGTGFRSGAAGTLDVYEFTFTTPGTYYYVCEPHAFSGMKGSVTVLPAGAPAATETSKWLTIALLAMAAGVVLWRQRAPQR